MAVKFNEILEVKSLELDIYQAEQKDSHEKLPFRSKFMIKLITKEYQFFAANEVERSIWLQSFAKVLEFNRVGLEKFNLRAFVDTFDYVKH